MMPNAPCKDAHLVEVEGQAGLERGKHGHVLRNLVVRSRGLGVVNLVQHVCAHVPLALAISANLVGHIHIHAAGQQPTGTALPVAHQPPVFQHRRFGIGQPGNMRCARGRCLRSGILRGSFCSLARPQRRLGSPLRHGRNLGNRGSRQKLNLSVRRQKIEPFRLAAGRQMQVDVVAHHAGGHHRVRLVLNAKLIKSIEGLGVDYRPLLNPSDLVLLCLHLEKAAAMLQHLQRLAIGHLGHAVGDGGHAVMQVHLPR